MFPSSDTKEMFCKIKCSNKTYLLKSLILISKIAPRLNLMNKKIFNLVPKFEQIIDSGILFSFFCLDKNVIHHLSVKYVSIFLSHYFNIMHEYIHFLTLKYEQQQNLVQGSV